MTRVSRRRPSRLAPRLSVRSGLLLQWVSIYSGWMNMTRYRNWSDTSGGWTAGLPMQCHSRGGGTAEDHVRLQRHKLDGVGARSLDASPSPAIVDAKIAAFRRASAVLRGSPPAEAEFRDHARRPTSIRRLLLVARAVAQEQTEGGCSLPERWKPTAGEIRSSLRRSRNPH